MKITYKYKIGQKVKLVKQKLYSDISRYDELSALVGQEVTIIERGFIIQDKTHTFRNEKNEKIEQVVFYYIEEDPYKKRNCSCNLCRFLEESLDGDANWETVDEQFETVDKVKIEPWETRVYDNVLTRCLNTETKKPEIHINNNFVFSTYGLVVGLRKNYEVSNFDLVKEYGKYKVKIREVKIAREFLTDFEPDEKHDWKTHPRQDAGAYGYESWVDLSNQPRLGSVYANIPDNYPELYVNYVINDDFAKRTNFNPFFDNNFKWEIEQWFRKFGVYDKIRELWDTYKPGDNNERTQKIKEHNDFLKRAKEFIDGLTEKQKEELKKML